MEVSLHNCIISQKEEESHILVCFTALLVFFIFHKAHHALDTDNIITGQPGFSGEIGCLQECNVQMLNK